MMELGYSGTRFTVRVRKYVFSDLQKFQIIFLHVEDTRMYVRAIFYTQI
jgi:hypothetical protein